MDLITLGLSKKYTEDIAIGLGADIKKLEETVLEHIKPGLQGEINDLYDLIEELTNRIAALEAKHAPITFTVDGKEYTMKAESTWGNWASAQMDMYMCNNCYCDCRIIEVNGNVGMFGTVEVCEECQIEKSSCDCEDTGTTVMLKNCVECSGYNFEKYLCDAYGKRVWETDVIEPGEYHWK